MKERVAAKEIVLCGVAEDARVDPEVQRKRLLPLDGQVVRERYDQHRRRGARPEDRVKRTQGVRARRRRIRILAHPARWRGGTA
jgi:hypothetical protein